MIFMIIFLNRFLIFLAWNRKYSCFHNISISSLCWWNDMKILFERNCIKILQFLQRIRIGRGSEKFRKRLVELESQLVLVSPNLVFRIKHRQNGRTYLFFLSSDFERTQWIEAILTLQRTGIPPSPTTNNASMFELQTWITACRTFLKTNMGSYLLRSGQDESLLVGDLHVFIYDLNGLEYTSGKFSFNSISFFFSHHIKHFE